MNAYNQLMSDVIRHSVLIEALKTELLKLQGSLTLHEEIRHDGAANNLQLKIEATEALIEYHYRLIDELSKDLFNMTQ